MGALDEARRLREEADLLLAFQSELPERAASVTLENPFAAEGEPATITLDLDPRYGVIDNANRRYARYHKLQRAASQIPLQIAANDAGACACRAVAGRPRAGRDAAGDRARA